MLVAFLAFILSAPCLALDSITNLPAGVSSPGWKQGFISNADQKYNSKGDLLSLSDINAVELDVDTMKAIEPNIKKLETALNKFGQNGLGSTLHLGVLKVMTAPEINYSVPTFGHGISDNWMIGVGIPVIQYSNRLSFSHTGSNLNELRAQFYGLSDNINEAFDRLDQDLVSVAQQSLSDKGYKPIVNRNQKFLGDIQLANFYLLYKSALLGVRWQSLVTLPTGPQDDPNDLLDLGAFGKTAWENSIVTNFYLWRDIVIALKGGFKWAIPDRIRVRVPLHSQDTLPDQNRLSLVNRDIGDSYSMGGSATYLWSNGISLSAGIESIHKSKDLYRGSLFGDYSVLEKNTSSFALASQFELSYDTISLYFAKKAMLPMILALKFSEHFRGRNVERFAQTELTANLFF